MSPGVFGIHFQRIAIGDFGLVEMSFSELNFAVQCKRFSGSGLFVQQGFCLLDVIFSQEVGDGASLGLGGARRDMPGRTRNDVSAMKTATTGWLDMM